MCLGRYVCFFFCKQKTAYEVRISDWSSDVCSSDLFKDRMGYPAKLYDDLRLPDRKPLSRPQIERDVLPAPIVDVGFNRDESLGVGAASKLVAIGGHRSEEHTSELQSLMRLSYAVFCLKKKSTNWNYAIYKIKLH